MIIKGEIEEIRFRNEENGYSIVLVSAESDDIICVGNFPPINVSETVVVDGEFVIHPKFGKQFKVSTAEIKAPESLFGIVKYLSSGLVKGVGIKTAQAIVDKFGDSTLDVIAFNPTRLSTIRGISKAKASDISMAFGSIKKMQDAMVFLQGHGISINLALKIYKEYGIKTLAKVKSNPYCLVEDIDGVGFLTADKIAISMGVKPDSEFRTRAGILYALRSSGEKNGNTYLPKTELCAESSKLLNVDESIILGELDSLVLSHKIKNLMFDDVEGYMLIPTYHTEKNAALSLVKLIEQSDKIQHDCQEEIEEFQRREKIIFHAQQIDAITTAINSGVCVITGGPGTGKTTIIKCILSILNTLKYKYALMAPTGRAAKRLSESTGEDATTIHRAFMLGHNSRENSVSDGEVLNVNAVIVDEVSMVDVFLLNTMLSRLPEGTRLIFVGDADQLPSVGAGNVLKDMLESKIVPTVRLTQIYRQADESLIITNAHNINSGIMPDLKRNDSDFFYSRASNPEDIARITVSMAAERIPKYLGVEPYRVQVLCPMKNGAAGANNLNRELQNTLNGAEKQQIITDDYIYRKNDKVMHVVNNYELEWRKSGAYETGEGVFNGDLGVIIEVRPASGELDVLYEDGRIVCYTPDVRSQLIPAYAITVHKSQGSEFDAVIVPIAAANPIIMTRNLLYTAITRAKKLVALVGDEYYIKRMVDNNYIALRYSALKKFLIEGNNEMRILYNE